MIKLNYVLQDKHSKNQSVVKLVLFTFFKGMSPTSSPIKETKAKTSYAVKLEIDFDIYHDTTSGRSIENLVEDIQDYILDNQELWDSFPFIAGACTSLISINQNSGN
jgi:hypothetical protein